MEKQITYIFYSYIVDILVETKPSFCLLEIVTTNQICHL